jgi:hypothetical protein
MRKQLIASVTVAIVTACAILTTRMHAAESYEWSAEFVALDEGSRSVTVKARLLDDTAVADAKQFKAGDRVVLVWSGMTFSDAVGRVLPSTQPPKAGEELLSSVEFVSTNAASRDVTFRTRVPGDDVVRLKTLKPGEWVTATSMRASQDGGAVVSIRPYTALRSATTSS